MCAKFARQRTNTKYLMFCSCVSLSSLKLSGPIFVNIMTDPPQHSQYQITPQACTREPLESLHCRVCEEFNSGLFNKCLCCGRWGTPTMALHIRSAMVGVPYRPLAPSPPAFAVRCVVDEKGECISQNVFIDKSEKVKCPTKSSTYCLLFSN